MALPNFLVIGAAKAGTTSLYHYLNQHQDVFMSPIKEPAYYCDAEQVVETPAIRDRAAYEQLFARAGGSRAVGEASPKYLNAVASLDRMQADLPGVRLIVSLRNPADRAYSSYLGRRQNGFETGSAQDVLRAGHYCFETSLYYPRLRRYFDRFPRHRIKVILFDDLLAQPRATMTELFAFLDVDPCAVIDVTRRHNAAVVPRFPYLNRAIAAGLRRARPFAPERLLWKGYGRRLRAPLLRASGPMPPTLRSRLLEQYCEDIRATGALVDRDLAHWLEPGRPGGRTSVAGRDRT